MKIHRFYNDKLELGKDFEVARKEKSGDLSDIFNQISNVLRLKEGERVIFFKNSNEHLYKIRNVNSKSLSFNFEKSYENIVDEYLESKPKINLYMSNIKKDKMEWCLEKTVELGVSSIYPIISDRTQNKIFNLERAQKIIKEAAEQCGRGKLANINEIKTLEKSLENIEVGDCINYICSLTKETSENFHKNDSRKEVNIWIGPEGGWGEEEEKLMLSKGFKTLNMGKTVLRAETAAIVAIAKIN